MSISRLLFRRGLGFPYATMLLVLACVITSLPMFYSTRYYLILGIGHGEVDRLSIEWGHRLVTPFVHGGGFPGLTAHLTINCVLFLVLGSLTERLLGAGRFAAVTFTSLAVHVLLKELIHQAHGASGMTWSYPLFVGTILVAVWRGERRGALRDPMFLFCGLLLVFEAVGLIKHWHLWNFLVSVPFFIVWRRVLMDNLARLERGGTTDRWCPICNRIGVAIAGVLCLFTSCMSGAAVAGLLH